MVSTNNLNPQKHRYLIYYLTFKKTVHKTYNKRVIVLFQGKHPQNHRIDKLWCFSLIANCFFLKRKRGHLADLKSVICQIWKSFIQTSGEETQRGNTESRNSCTMSRLPPPSKVYCLCFLSHFTF